MRCVIYILILCMLTACGTCRKVTETNERRSVSADSVYHAVNSRDSVYVRDSVIIIERHDSVIVYHEREIKRVLDRSEAQSEAVHDTLYVEKTATIERQKEACISKWQKIGIIFALASIVALTSLFIIKLKK